MPNFIWNSIILDIYLTFSVQASKCQFNLSIISWNCNKIINHIKLIFVYWKRHQMSTRNWVNRKYSKMHESTKYETSFHFVSDNWPIQITNKLNLQLFNEMSCAYMHEISTISTHRLEVSRMQKEIQP